jgi:RNA polymerase sigma factor (sigma-70 family)
LNSEYPEIHRDLILQSLAGDIRSQFELYRLYARPMFNICMRMLVRKEDAEDALQDAFSEVFDKLEDFGFRASFGAWVKRIVVNTCINRLRKKIAPLILKDELSDLASDDPVVDKEDIEWQVGSILSAMEKLPDGYRTILSLYLFEGYDHNEISEILGISESTSRTQYLKARRKIKENLNFSL